MAHASHLTWMYSQHAQVVICQEISQNADRRRLRSNIIIDASTDRVLYNDSLQAHDEESQSLPGRHEAASSRRFF